MKALRHLKTQRGFTLVEILVSMAILSILVLVCSNVVEQTQKTWVYTKSKADQFRGARRAFELITRNLSQATLNTYLDYYYPETDSNQPPADVSTAPAGYVRQSELQFRNDKAWKLLGPDASASANPGHATFFQAPLGLSFKDVGLGSLLNARGYFIKFDSDKADRPAFIAESGAAPKFRYRLFEYRPPAEQSTSTDAPFKGDTIYSNATAWYQDDLAASSSVIADNVWLLLFTPRVSDEAAKSAGKDPSWIAPDYRYNSLDRDNATDALETVRVRPDGSLDQGTRHLLPPMVTVTMVAVDEMSAQRWTGQRANKPVDILSESGASFDYAANYASDLAKLKTYLTDQKLNYRVFTATVLLRNAQWDGTAL